MGQLLDLLEWQENTGDLPVNFRELSDDRWDRAKLSKSLEGTSINKGSDAYVREISLVDDHRLPGINSVVEVMNSRDICEIYPSFPVLDPADFLFFGEFAPLKGEPAPESGWKPAWDIHTASKILSVVCNKIPHGLEVQDIARLGAIDYNNGTKLRTFIYLLDEKLRVEIFFGASGVGTDKFVHGMIALVSTAYECNKKAQNIFSRWEGCTIRDYNSAVQEADALEAAKQAKRLSKRD
jgi:hypothetical protein